MNTIGYTIYVLTWTYISYMHVNISVYMSSRRFDSLLDALELFV